MASRTGTIRDAWKVIDEIRSDLSDLREKVGPTVRALDVQRVEAVERAVQSISNKVDSLKFWIMAAAVGGAGATVTTAIHMVQMKLAGLY